MLYCCIMTSCVGLLLASNRKYCQIGYFYSKEKESCECCNTTGEIKCAMSYVYVANGQCLTWNNATQDTEISRCLYSQNDLNLCDNSNMYNISTNITGSTLNNIVCKLYNRHGTHCRQCIDGYGPAAFSDGITCADCSKYRQFWILNLLLQLTMVTFLYVVVILLQIKGTSSPFNLFITYGQVGINAFMVPSGFYANAVCFAGRRFTTLILTIVGIVNLDIFRFVIPPLCISTSLKSINVLLLDYIIAVYPIILTVVIYVGIELHDRRCWMIIRLTTPLKCFWRRNWNPRETILNTCATFLLLSYSKFLFVSFNLLVKVQSYSCRGEIIPDSAVLLFDPQIKFFHSEHAPYVVLALSMILIFVVLPPLLLLLYPTRFFRRCLSCCGVKRWDILHLVMDIFQGWYKAGTDGTYDYRPLSSLYMILRMVSAASYIALTVNAIQNSTLEFAMGVSHVFLGTMFLVVHPYKVKWMNNVDGLILTVLGVLILIYVPENKIIYLVAVVLGLCVIIFCSSYYTFKCMKHFFASVRSV